ncbi:MAG: gliding motility-associated C-terminal domain-containing protein, partial [Bacteroidota bacterium]
FCLAEERGAEPVTFLAEWSSATEVLCVDTMEVLCSSCLEVVADTLRCEEEALAYSFSFINKSPYPVNTVSILPAEEGSAGDILLAEGTIDLAREVPVGARFEGQIPIRFLDVNGDGVFCFDVVLRRKIASLNVSTDCCYTTHCIPSIAEVIARPEAVLADSLFLRCEDMPQLDASESRPETVQFAWTALNGGNILSGANGPRPFVEGAGEYRLIVGLTDNGCTDTASIIVVEEELVAASLPANPTDCRLPQTITGNLPPGTSGRWEAIGNQNGEWTAAGNMATVTGLTGNFGLAWILSTPDCPDYSADTITFGSAVELIAVDDTLGRFDAAGFGEIDLLENDVYSGSVSIRLTSNHSAAILELLPSGIVRVRIDPCTTENAVATYEIRSEECGTQLATATLFLRSSINNEEARFNAISPNGDGMNDQFVFDQIERCPLRWPERKITIFNRWGDILYEAAPYNNDWEGTNSKGVPIPEGTYYYILRLAVGEGDIIRGDVTVIR